MTSRLQATDHTAQDEPSAHAPCTNAILIICPPPPPDVGGRPNSVTTVDRLPDDRVSAAHPESSIHLGRFDFDTTTG